MEKVRKFLEPLSNKEFGLRYPDFKPSDGKKHILYLCPPVNGIGLYRAILPAMHLNQTNTHSAIISDVRLLDSSSQDKFKSYNTELNEQLIQWADYLCLQTHYNDLTEDIMALRKENPKLQVIMDVDDYDYALPPWHVHARHYTRKMNEQILDNMALCNVVTCSTEILAESYERLLKDRHPDCPTQMYVLPNLMSKICFEGVPKNKPQSNGVVNIGLTLNHAQFGDVNPIRNIMQSIKEKYKDKVKFTVFGWNGKLAEKSKNCLQGVEHVHIPSVDIFEYFKTLHGLNYDFALMPLAPNKYNICKTNHKLMQYAMLGIPAIVQNIGVYTDPIYFSAEEEYTEDKCINALVVDKKKEWEQHIDLLISNKKKRKQLAQDARKTVMDNYMIEDHIDIWTRCFV